MPPDHDGQWGPLTRIPADPGTLLDPFDSTVTITDTRGVFVVHAVLLHTGKLLWFCGHVEGLFYPALIYLFDPTAPPTTKLVAKPMPADLFCCHYVQLMDGRILVLGGSQQDDAPPVGGLVYHGSSGAKTVAIFDPVSESWSIPSFSLTQGRWYPTAVMLGDGRPIVVSGRREDGAVVTNNPAGIADRVEVFSPRVDSRHDVGGTTLQLPIYPGLHLAPDGQVYTTHTTWGQEIPEPAGQRLDVHGNNTGAWTPVPSPAQNQREEGMSVLLPVTLPRTGSRGRILLVGGGQALGHQRQNPAVAGLMAQIGGNALAAFTGHASGVSTKSAEILDTTATPPAWSAAPGTLAKSRVNGHLVLLPDATVLVLGGHDGYKWDASANQSGVTRPVTMPSLQVEIFTPGVGFTVGAAMAKPRMYHSCALLLPDGRVIVVGGADPNETEPALAYPSNWRGRTYRGDPTGPKPRKNGSPLTQLNRKDYQIYSPPYLFKGPRPVITSVTPANQVQYGSTFKVSTPQAASIKHVAIMRPGAVTHHTDSEQRYVELEFTASGTDLTVTMLPAAECTTAPPGYYMVWIVDAQGRPCARAPFVQLAFPPPPPPRDDSIESWPCLVVTVTMGSPDAAEVRHLQALRAELAAGTPLGRRFVAAVNRCYYAVSPSVAAWLRHRPLARAAVRDVAVRPAATAVRCVDRLTRGLSTGRSRAVVLIVLLVLLAAAAAVLSPVVALALLAHVAVQRARRRGPGDG
ncbi:MAG: galactose oxidase-like domain-containing protein [Frankiaceae bacterium]